MTTRYILQVALLLCFSTTALTKSLDWLGLRQRTSTVACQDLLKALNGTPEFCLEDRMNFRVPKELEKQQQLRKEDIPLIIREMLQQIFRIFGKNVSNAGWDETIIEMLLVELDKQMDHLDTILENIENSNWGSSETMLHLKSYYSRIDGYLKARDYSSCAWTVVRVEILRNFSFIHTLTYYL
ncbi:interferon beta [Rhynchocyon petersi]